MYRCNKGENLIELVLVLSVGTIVIGSLVFATISSLRNASLAKNHAQATKLAQEGIERVKTARDRVATIDFGSLDTSGRRIAHGTPMSWQDSQLWTNSISSLCGTTPIAPNCYLQLDSANNLVWFSTGSNFPSGTGENIPGGQFERAVILSDDPSTYTMQKTVTVIVRWQEPTGSNESKITTVLRKINK